MRNATQTCKRRPSLDVFRILFPRFRFRFVPSLHESPGETEAAHYAGHPGAHRGDREDPADGIAADAAPRRLVSALPVLQTVQPRSPLPRRRHHHDRIVGGQSGLNHQIFSALLLLRRDDLHRREELRPGALLFRGVHLHARHGDVAHHARVLQEVHPRLADPSRQANHHPEVLLAGHRALHEAAVAALPRAVQRVHQQWHARRRPRCHHQIPRDVQPRQQPGTGEAGAGDAVQEENSATHANFSYAVAVGCGESRLPRRTGRC